MSQHFSDDTIGALEFTVTWEQDGIRHEEWFLGRRFNAVNDIYPRGMRKALEGKEEGESVSFTYEPRMFIPRHKDKLVRELPLYRLRKKTRLGKPIIPRVGRFYPQGHIDGLLDVYPDTLTPFRLTELTDDTFTADCNHPLALIPVTIKATIQYLEKRDTGTYGSMTHWREVTCDWGPGMQALLNGQSPDFYQPDFFDRQVEDDVPFSPPPMDETARANFKGIARRFTTPDMRILTLTTESPLSLDGEYDALVCTRFMEYQSAPVDVLKTIKPHLKPGAPVILGFTNRFDATRVIHGWTELHQFEWMGLGLDYLRQAGMDADAGTVSMRNDWRPKDDPRFLETRGVSDSLFVSYGHNR